MVRKLSTSTTTPSSNPHAPISSTTNVTNTSIPIGSTTLRNEYIRNQAAKDKAPLRGAARVPLPLNTTSFQQVYEEDEEEEAGAAHHEERVVNTNTRARDDIKVDIPSYDGGEDPEEFIDWCRRLERIFEYKGFGEEKMFQVAVMKLTKYASLWYDGFKHMRQRKGKHKISTWQELKKQMTKRFVPFDYRQNVFLRLNDLMQGNSSVSSYVHEFESLQMICGLDEQEEMMIARFVRGLERSIRSKLDLHLYVRFRDVAKRAISIEKNLLEDKASRPMFAKPSIQGKGFGFRGNNNTTTTPRTTPATNANTIPLGTRQYGEDTRGKAPATSNANANLVPNVVNKNKKCFRCHGFGHFQNECPSKRVTYVEVEVEDGSKECVEVEEENIEEEEVVEQCAEEGEMLILRRMLHAKPKSLNEAQRKHLSH